MYHPGSEQFSLLRIKLPYLLYPFVFSLLLISLAACGQQPGTELSAQDIPPPTLTPLSTEWVELTLVFDDENDTDTTDIAIEPTEVVDPPTSTPIPTASATMVNATPTEPAPTLVQPSTPTLAPTSTPIPLPTNTPTVTPIPETVQQRNLLIASRSRSNVSLSIDHLQRQIRSTQGHLTDLNFMVGQLQSGSDLDCQKLATTYEAVRTDSPIYIGSESQQVSLFHYNNAVEMAIINFYPLYDLCHSEALIGDGQYQWLARNRISAETLFPAEDTRSLIMTNINDALAWSNGDLNKTRNLYERTRNSIRRLHQLINDGTSDGCPEIQSIYANILDSPRLTPTQGAAREAYSNYLDALRFAEVAIAPIDQFCADHENKYKDIDPDDWPLLSFPLDMQGSSLRLLLRSMTAMNKAIELLPLAMPAPTLAPIWGQVLDVRASDVPEHYEVVVQVYDRTGGDTYSNFQIGDFLMMPNWTVTVIHSCERDFVDEIDASNSAGNRIESPKLFASRHESCFNQ